MNILFVVIAAFVLSIASMLLVRYIIVTVNDAKLTSLIAPYLRTASEIWRANTPEARCFILIEARIAANYADTLTYLEWNDLPINVRTAFTNHQTRMESRLELTPRMRSRLVLCQLTQPHRMHPADRMYLGPEISVQTYKPQTLKRAA